MGFQQLLGVGGPSAVAAAFSYDAVNFNGSTYMSRAAFMSDGSQLTVTAFVKSTVAGSTICSYDNGHVVLQMSAGQLSFQVSDSSYANSFGVVAIPTPALDDGNWHSIAISIDTNFAAGSKKASCVIDRVLQSLTLTDTNPAFNIRLAANNWAVGYDFGSGFFNGDMCEVTTQPTYIDWSVGANVNKFFTAGNKPVDLGSNGSTAYGSAAASYNHIAAAEAAANFATDRGGGTTYTVTGTLATAGSKP